MNEFHRLDIAVNNGGEPQPTIDFLEVDLALYDKIMDVNLRGTFVAMQNEVRAMLMSGGGSIINISAAAVLMGVAGKGVYVASKHGVVGLTKSTAVEYASRNIRANTIAPGEIVTDMFNANGGASAENRAKLLAKTPVGRLGTPYDIVGCAVWLASDGASFTTGTVISN